MKDHNLNQCIIISGESGSGKTEASKLVMQYVAAILSRGEEVEYVKKQLLQSNPVLEGNHMYIVIGSGESGQLYRKYFFSYR